jgi:hypothetical protein
MLTANDIVAEIEKIKEHGGLNRVTYEQLGWLYIIHDHMCQNGSVPLKAKMSESNIELDVVTTPTTKNCDTECKLSWVDNMVNEDGTKGAHWSMEQTKNVLRQRDSNISPEDFYVAMNMMYSDYYKVAKRFNVSSLDFYASMAEAFLNDKDTAENKLSNYFEYVVK